MGIQTQCPGPPSGALLSHHPHPVARPELLVMGFGTRPSSSPSTSLGRVVSVGEYQSRGGLLLPPEAGAVSQREFIRDPSETQIP